MMIGLGIGLTMRQNVRARSVLSTLGASAAFAAGPRRLTDSYSGALMRVRRSSDNVEADIGFTAAGDLDTVALLAHTGAGDGFVSKLYDQSGNGRDLAQATAANQPRIVLAGVVDKLNARPAVRTDGAAQIMATASFVIPQPFSRASVVQFLAVGVSYLFDSAFNTSRASLLINPSATLDMYAGTDTSVKAGIAVNDTATIVETFSGAASKGSYNGAVSNVSPGVAGMDGLKLSSDVGGGFKGSLLYADIIIFPTALSTNDRQSLEANQKAYYGTP